MSHIIVYGRPLNKKWWQFWQRDIKLKEGSDYILDGYDIKCINSKVRHNYRLVIQYSSKFKRK